MIGPQAAESGLSPWHRLLEHYTPDGALGRLLLAAVAGSTGGAALLAAIWAAAASVLLWPLAAFAATAVGLVGASLALVALWPVYLSLIGNVESASAYPGAGIAPPPTDAGTDPDDAVALLKRRYAAGELSEPEFERRLDDLLGADAALAAEAEAARTDGRADPNSERN